MSSDSARYPRRKFLGQCAAIPLAAGLAAACETAVTGGEQAPAISLSVPMMPRADLAREVESLLRLVDPQVVYRYSPVAAGKNAWPIWKQAGERYIEQPEDEEFQEGAYALLDDGTAPPDSVRRRIVGWVQRNEECRKLVDQGIARGGLEYPRAGSSIWLPLAMDEFTLLRKLARLKGLYGQFRLNQRDATRAMDEAASIVAMGKMLVRSECMLVDFLVSIGIGGIGANVAYRAANSPDASDDLVKSAIETLAEAKRTNDELKRALRIEFCRWFLPYVAGIQQSASHSELAVHYVVGDDSPPKTNLTEVEAREYRRSIRVIAILLEGHPKAFDKMATIRLGSQLYVRHFKEMDSPWIKRNRNILESLDKELSAWPSDVDPIPLIGLPDEGRLKKRGELTDKELKQARDALRGVDNVFGKYLVRHMACGVFGHDLVERNVSRLDSQRIRLALRFFEKHRSRLPQRLDDLVAEKLLPEMPRDPYDGGRFKYSPETRVIWCVGAKGTNVGVIPPQREGGVPFFEDYELTWRIARP